MTSPGYGFGQLLRLPSCRSVRLYRGPRLLCRTRSCRKVTSARGKARLLWLCGGAMAMGLGIWSMHYIGMLAFRLPLPVQYDWPTVSLSLMAAVLASAVALFVVSRHQMGVVRASSAASDGRRYRSHALHWHGGDAIARYVPLFSLTFPTFGSSRDCDFFRGFMADLLFPNRDDGLELAQGS